MDLKLIAVVVVEEMVSLAHVNHLNDFNLVETTNEVVAGAKLLSEAVAIDVNCCDDIVVFSETVINRKTSVASEPLIC